MNNGTCYDPAQCMYTSTCTGVMGCDPTDLLIDTRTIDHCPQQQQQQQQDVDDVSVGGIGWTCCRIINCTNYYYNDYVEETDTIVEVNLDDIGGDAVRYTYTTLHTILLTILHMVLLIHYNNNRRFYY